MTKPMQTIIDMAFKTNGGKRLGLMRRTYNVDFVPIISAEIEDIAFRNVKTILAITINPIDHYYMLKIEDEIVSDQTECSELMQAFERHGWEKIM